MDIDDIVVAGIQNGIWNEAVWEGGFSFSTPLQSFTQPTWYILQCCQVQVLWLAPGSLMNLKHFASVEHKGGRVAYVELVSWVWLNGFQVMCTRATSPLAHTDTSVGVRTRHLCLFFDTTAVTKVCVVRYGCLLTLLLLLRCT